MKTIQTVGVAGAGAMGRGIAQIAAQAGLRVKLFDTNPAALNSARDSLTNTWTMLASKGKMTEEQAHEAFDVSRGQDLDRFAAVQQRASPLLNAAARMIRAFRAFKAPS